MASAAGTFEFLVRELAEALRPLERRLASGVVDGVLDDLGLRLPSGFSDQAQFANALAAGAATAAELPARIAQLTAAIDADDVVQIVASGQALLETVTQLINAIPQIAAGLSAAAAGFGGLTPAERAEIHSFAQELPRRLLDLLVVDYLEATLPAGIPPTLALLGFMDRELEPGVAGNALRPPFLRKTLHLERISKLFGDPAGYMREVYDWGSPTFDGLKLIENVRRFVGDFLDMPADVLLAPGLPPILEAYLFALRVNPATTPPGVVVDFRFPATQDFERVYPLRLPWALKVTANARFVADVEVEITPPLDTSLRPPSGVANIDFTAGLAADGTGNPLLLLGEAGGTRLEATHVSLSAGFATSFDGMSARGEPLGTIEVRGGKLIISMASSDGFIQTILAGVSVQSAFELRARWRPSTGIVFEGGTGIELVFPTHLNLGPVEIQSLYFKLGFTSETPLRVEVAATLVAMLGPLTISVDGVGAAFNFTFPAQRNGNLGVADLDLQFKPPNGIGLTIDAPGVVGGGYLGFEPQTAEYSGFLQLELAETIAVKAMGLLTTRLPDGSKGFSLLILLAAEGFAPIQLGFGFTLTGIGGLLGVNRTVAVEVLRSGLKTGSLNALLFPEGPVRQAPQLVSALRAVFPPVPNRYVVGPMVQLAWGTPTLLTLELAVVLELPEPVRLLVLGRLQALLPEAAHALIQVRMDAIGLLDFDRGDVALDATLYDSRIVQFALTGDMALRANWGAQPTFVLALGGFHPRFPAPAGFPPLARLALSLGDGDHLQLRCDAYLALTSNTVQFGARLDLHAAGGGFSFDGSLGFDALVQLAPLAFVVDIGAALALRYRGHLLLGIFFSGSLAGPTPWHVQGKATIKVLFFKVSVRFAHRFGAAAPPPLPAPVDVLARLLDALQDRRHWSATVPRGEPPVVVLREAAPPVAGLRVHPLAELTVRQRVVPLGRRITQLGSAPLVGGPTTFTVAVAGLDSTPLREPFALAQYEALSDDAKLARPAFEPQEAGLQLAVEAVAYEYEARLDPAIAYETLLIAPTRPADPAATPYGLPLPVLDAVVSLGAAGQAAFRRRGSSRYRAPERAA